MNRDEAKFILTAYRPDGRDAGDPALAEPLRQSSVDPVLAAWFERSRAFDAAVADKLGAVAPPPGLRESILAGVRMSGSARKRRTRLARFVLAVAAAGAIWFGLDHASVSRSVSPPTAFAEFALDDLIHGHHGGTGEPTGDFQTRLAATSAPLPSEVGMDYGRLQTTGCRTLHFAGRELLEVCFARGGGEFHLYIAPRTGGPGYGSASAPVLVTEAAGAAAVWSDAHFDYAVVSQAGLAAVQRLFR